MEEIKQDVNLDAPFQADAPAGDNAEPDTEVKGEDDKIEPEELSKPKVPYSRFENVSRARREAEAEAEKWRQRALELEESRFKPQQSGEIPQDWIQLYGDTEQSRAAWKIQSQREDALMARAEERAFQRLQGAREEEQAATRQNLETIDEHLEIVSEIAGRELTETEQSRILDIIDEGTAKDDDGNYLGAIMPPQMAWKVYELETQTGKSGSKRSRDNVARATSASSSGEPTADQIERNKNWKPWSSDRWPKEQ